MSPPLRRPTCNNLCLRVGEGGLHQEHLRGHEITGESSNMFRDSVLASPVLRRGVTALAVAAAATMFVGTAATAEPAAVVGEVSADSIAAARAQAIGTTVTVVGTATTPSGVFESSFYDKGFGLQSGNSGIYISDPNNSGIALGDQVQVTGVLADQEGLLVVRPTAVEVIGTTTQISPARLPLNAIGEGSEGRLVTVSGIVSGPVVDDLPYGHKILVSGVDGDTVIFVNTQTGIDVDAVAVGRPITVTGFSGQYASTYEVLPRSEADVQQGFTGSLSFGS